jgi:hypothetical protein
LKEYLPSSDWSLAIALTDAGETLVWDQQSHRVLSKLPGLGELEAPPVITDSQGHRVYDIPNGEIQSAAFSPDRTHVAIFSGPNDVFKLRLSIWNIQTGQKERDLWPVLWASYPSGQPVWWNDGHWLVAPYASQFSPGGTGVWDTKTGRFQGALDLSGCPTGISPVAEGARLLQSCSMAKGEQDKVLEWSTDEINKQIESTENLVLSGQDSPQ